MHDRSGSGDYHLVNNGNNPSGLPPANFQNKWSWCWNFQALWLSADSGGKARCLAGPLAYHKSTGSADYALHPK